MVFLSLVICFRKSKKSNSVYLQPVLLLPFFWNSKIILIRSKNAKIALKIPITVNAVKLPIEDGSPDSSPVQAGPGSPGF